MNALLGALAVGVLAAAQSASSTVAVAQVQPSRGLFEAFAEACIHTAMDREVFQGMALERRWEALEYSRENDTNQEWGLRYVSEGVQYVLSGQDRVVRVREAQPRQRSGRGAGGRRSDSVMTYPAFRNCVVAGFDEDADPSEGMQALARSLGYGEVASSAVGPMSIPAGGSGRRWQGRDGFLGWSRDPASGLMRIEIYRLL